MKKRQITRKTFVLTAVIGSVILTAIMIATVILSTERNREATDEAVSAVSEFYLEAMADRRARTISNLIDNNFEQMEKALEFIGEEDIHTQDELRLVIGRVKSLLSLNRFALVDEDDIVYTRYTTYTGGSRHAFLSGEMMDKRCISTVFLYGSSKQLCLSTPTPGLIVMGKPMKACFVQIDIKEISDLLAFEDEGRTYFGVYSRNGENLTDTELGPFISGKPIFEALKGVVSDEVLNENIRNFSEGIEGSISFTADGADETLCYVPIEGTDWKMVVLIHESVIHDRIREISERSIKSGRNMLLLILALVFVLATLLLVQLRILLKSKIDAEEERSRKLQSMANTDSMTGVRNKHAYSEYELELNRQIKENEIKKLAVIVCDVNGLKLVNDTKGHAAGDKLIKDACTMLCEYFNHGAVFRIGGDEFAVILREKGFDTMSEVIEEFNRKVEDNIRTKEVVISIGVSTLKEDDEQFHDGFERADHQMYERKKELKKMGAPTRPES